MGARKRLREEFRLWRELARAMAGAPTLEEALRVALAAVCRRAGWVLGQAWLPSPDGSRLECSPAWWGEDPATEAFRRVSAAVALKPGEGLPGRAFVSGEPAWTRDAGRDRSASRAQGAREAGLRSGVAVPVADGDEVVAVLEFFSKTLGPRDERFGALLWAAAAQLGALIRHKRMQEALRASEERFRAVAAGGRDAIVGCDQRGRITYLNQGAEALFGWGAAEAVGRPFALLVPPEAGGEILSLLASVVAAPGEPSGRLVESTMRRRDGSTFPVELSVAAWTGREGRQLTVIVRDLSEAHAALARERRRAEQLGRLAAATRELAGILDLAELLPALARAARDVAGCRGAALGLYRGDGSLRFVADGLSPAELERVRHALQTGRVPAHLVAVPVEGAGALCLWGGGQQPFDEVDRSVAEALAGYAAQAIGMARAFRRERELVRRLEALDRMKDAFLTAVSHELRTPLTAVLGFAHTLRSEGERLPPERRRELVARLGANAARLDGLLSDLLDLDRLRRGVVEPRRRPTDVGGLVRRVLEATGVVPGRHLHLEVEPARCWADPAMVERMVESLLAHAVRRTPAGSQVWVRVRPEGRGVLIAVEDAGPGLPPECREELFEPFSGVPQAPPHAPGVGVGLALVARFAGLHGGRAWVEDRRGGGASFRVWLPGGVEAEAPRQAAAAPEARAARRRQAAPGRSAPTLRTRGPA